MTSWLNYMRCHCGITWLRATRTSNTAEEYTIRPLRGKHAPHVAEDLKFPGTGSNKGNGSACFYDSECATGRCAKHLQCENLLVNGKTCGADNDCVTGRCAFGKLWKFTHPTCAPKLAGGESCMKNNDCQSDACESTKCRGTPTPSPTNPPTNPPSTSPTVSCFSMLRVCFCFAVFSSFSQFWVTLCLGSDYCLIILHLSILQPPHQL